MSWGCLGIVFAACAVLCAVGFYKAVYFISIGYGFAIAGGGITTLIIALTRGNTDGLVWLAVIQSLLFVAYGVRLSGFLLVREIKNAAYRKVLKEIAIDDNKLPLFVCIVMWLSVAVLYTAQLSPMLYRWLNGSRDIAVPLIGAVLSVIGLILEGLADSQKSAQKKKNPNMVATKGLYKVVRCPNYFGEIIFWTGVFVGGTTTYNTVGQWIMAIAAYVSIVFIMFNGAQRLEKRQEKNYGDKKEYRDYAEKTPIIIPLLPIYHLNKKKN